LGRIIALDFGEKRTGIAVTDPLKIIASGLTTVATKDLLTYLSDYFNKEQVAVIVLGEPKQMNGTPSESEQFIQPFLVKLKEAFPHINIERQDERFTSKLAFKSMLDTGLKKKHRKNKALVDEISATIILQAYLEKIAF